MITVIAPYPTRANEKDGMIQRVAAIDSLMKDLPRSYLDLSFRRYLKAAVEVKGKVTIYRLNALLHLFRVFRLLRQSDRVYVHSAYNALKILPFLSSRKVIFDAHGVVPEELEQEGHRWASRILAVAEKAAVRHCSVMVSVTRRMQQHFANKYGRRTDRDIVYPILPHFDGEELPSEEILGRERPGNSVIYAGGLQVWQNVDKMIEASARRSEMTHTFLTSDAERLRDKLQQAGIKNFTCASVPASSVKNHYLTHSFGYILREEILVNAVACPTKLIEYLYWGVIPIVITPRIGDFDDRTLRCLTLTGFLNGPLPSEQERRVMREQNRKMLERLVASTAGEQSRLAQNLLGART
jgi:hypothetical protein